YVGHIHPLQTSQLQQICRPIQIGCSVGHFQVTAGTLGAFVKAQQGGAMILSNNHVLADENRANQGEDILQPGNTDDGHDPQDRIGQLSNYIRLDFTGTSNQADCAVATLDNSLSIDTGILGVGRLTGVAETIDCMELVSKMGRTTGLTQG